MNESSTGPLADARLKGPWSPDQVIDYLQQEQAPLRLALSGRDGFPLVVSLWYRWAEDAIWCATHRDSRVVRRLEADPRIGFEVSVNDPPYYGVRGQARVELLPERGESELRALLERYLGGTDSDLAGWLLGRADGEVALRIRPHWLASWDFRRRMRDSVRR